MPATKRTSEAEGQTGCGAALLRTETASYAMVDLPTWEVVARDGQLWWRVCGAGICVEDTCGSRAKAEYEAICRSMGVEPPRGGPLLPERGPSEVDEPGV